MTDTAAKLKALADKAGGVYALARTMRYRTSVTPQSLYSWLKGQEPNKDAARWIEREYAKLEGKP